MKIKKIAMLLLSVVMALFCFASCDIINSVLGTEEGNSVKVYTVKGYYNSETVNQWKNIYLLDEDNYVLTVKSLDSKDPSIVTADFYMAGTYTLSGDTLTLAPGYGYMKAMNGAQPMEFPIAPAANQMSQMYSVVMGTTSNVFTLLEDGTFEDVEA